MQFVIARLRHFAQRTKLTVFFDSHILHPIDAVMRNIIMAFGITDQVETTVRRNHRVRAHPVAMRTLAMPANARSLLLIRTVLQVMEHDRLLRFNRFIQDVQRIQHLRVGGTFLLPVEPALIRNVVNSQRGIRIIPTLQPQQFLDHVLDLPGR